MPRKVYARWETQDEGLTVRNGEVGVGVYAFLDSIREAIPGFVPTT